MESYIPALNGHLYIVCVCEPARSGNRIVPGFTGLKKTPHVKFQTVVQSICRIDCRIRYLSDQVKNYF